MLHFQEQDIGTSPENLTIKKGCPSSVVYLQQVGAYNIVFFSESIGQITTTIPGGLNLYPLVGCKNLQRQFLDDKMILGGQWMAGAINEE